MSKAFFGGLYQGLSEGMERGRKSQQEREELNIRKKYTDSLIRARDAEDKLNQIKLKEALLRFSAAQPFLEGSEEQVTLPGVAPQPTEGPLGGVQFSPELALPETTVTRRREPSMRERAIGSAILSGNVPAELLKERTDPVETLRRLQGSGLGGGQTQFIPSIGGTGEVMFRGERVQQPMSGDALQQLYGLSPERANILATLPAEAQARSLMELDRQRREEGTERRFLQSQEAMESRFGRSLQQQRERDRERGERAPNRIELLMRAAGGDQMALKALEIESGLRGDPLQKWVVEQLSRGPQGGTPTSPPPVPAPAPRPQAAPQGQGFANLPDPKQFKGKTARDTQSGARYRSDGVKWIPVP